MVFPSRFDTSEMEKMTISLALIAFFCIVQSLEASINKLGEDPYIEEGNRITYVNLKTGKHEQRRYKKNRGCG